MAKSDIVLISFPFTDLSGSKLRPAIVLAESEDDLTVCFITTQLGWQAHTDLLLEPTSRNGLKKPSVARVGKIATLHEDLVTGLIGRLSTKETDDLNDKLREVFQLQ